MNGPIVEATTAKDAFVPNACEGLAVRWNTVYVAGKHVLAPFPHVARHIINAQLIRCLSRNGLRMVAVLPTVPCHGVDIVTPAESEGVWPVRSTASGVLPLGLRRKAKPTHTG